MRALIQPKAQHNVATDPALGAGLQDNLLTAASDLQRLQGLLDDSHRSLQDGFFGTLDLLQALHAAGHLDAEPLARATQQLACAVKALQLQDMATQLIAHTHARLHSCADQCGHDDCARDTASVATPIAALGPNPVAQSAMDTGHSELF